MSYSDELSYQTDLARELTNTVLESRCTCGKRGEQEVVYWADGEAGEAFARDSEPVGEFNNVARGFKIGRPLSTCPKCGGELMLIQVVFDEPALPSHENDETL
jgi:hypothetical protein